MPPARSRTPAQAGRAPGGRRWRGIGAWPPPGVRSREVEVVVGSAGTRSSTTSTRPTGHGGPCGGIGEQVAKAEQAVAGKAPGKRNRFIQLSGGTRTVNRELEAKARALAGIKGYVTNLRA